MDPLFGPSRLALLQRLQLSKLEAGGELDVIVDDGILEARVRLLRELADNRRQALIAQAYPASPQTDEEIIRALAFTVEADMVLLYLIQRLPQITLQSASAEQTWNQAVGLLTSNSSLAERRARLENKISQNLAILEAGSFGAASDGADVALIPSDKAPNLLRPNPISRGPRY